MAARGDGGGGIKASPNMWALLAANDPGDSDAAMRLDREAKLKKHKEPAAAPPPVVVANGEDVNNGPSSRVVQSRRGAAGNMVVNGPAGDKKKPPRKTKQQKKAAATPAPAAQVSSREKPDPAASTGKDGAASVYDSDGEDENGDDEAGGSRCRAVLRGLLKAAFATALLAVYFHLAAPA